MAIDYRKIVAEFLSGYHLQTSRSRTPDQLIIDHEHGHYLLLNAGWEGQKRTYHVVMHINVTDGKVQIQRNQTDRDIEAELIEAGVNPQDIVLELVPPEYRAMVGKP